MCEVPFARPMRRKRKRGSSSLEHEDMKSMKRPRTKIAGRKTVYRKVTRVRHDGTKVVTSEPFSVWKRCPARDEYGNRCERPTPHRASKYTKGYHEACGRSFTTGRKARK